MSKKFPKMKVILNTVIAFPFGGAAPLVGTLTQNKVINVVGLRSNHTCL